MPKKQFDLNQVEALGKIGATQEEMSVLFNCGLRTIERAMSGQSAFRRAYKKGEVNRKVSLRRKQIQLAEAGDRTMLIWRGKQDLDQKDHRKEEHVGKDGGPIDIRVGWPDSEGKQGKK
jgi:hypothetical protein|tara:strand:+ start:101 stop:457 length:357 start_codon:yes stop_codon:yes gene_type:complete